MLLAFGPTLSAGITSFTADIISIKTVLGNLFAGKFSTADIFKGVFSAALGDLNKFAASLNSNIDIIVGLFAGLPDRIIGFFRNIDFGSVFDGLLTSIRTVGGPLVASVQEAVASIKNAFSNIDFSAIGTSLLTAITSAISSIGGAVNAGIDTIVQAFASLPGRIAGAVSGISQILVTPFQTAIDTIVGLWDRVINKIREVLGLGQQAAAAADTAGGAGTGGDFNPGGFAGGGFVWGPGTATSDSILARLSRGEVVINAAAVKYYGLDRLLALNAMRLPKLPGFSLGGLADGLGRTLRANLAIPAFAAGGPVLAPARAAAVPITLDLRTDRGRFRGSAMADRDVAEALSRFAVIDQITSMGKKSGAY